jgi:hypothetical protein
MITKIENPQEHSNICAIKIKGRPKKIEKYQNERENILKKINLILNFNENNNSFILYELDNDIDTQNKVLDLVRDIKEYFPCSKWSFFNATSNLKKEYLSLIRSIYKYMGYTITYKTIKIKKESNIISTIIYYFFKKNI